MADKNRVPDYEISTYNPSDSKSNQENQNISSAYLSVYGVNDKNSKGGHDDRNRKANK